MILTLEFVYKINSCDEMFFYLHKIQMNLRLEISFTWLQFMSFALTGLNGTSFSY